MKTISEVYCRKGGGLGPLALPPGLQKVVENNYWFFLGQGASQDHPPHITGRDLDLSLAEEEEEELDGFCGAAAAGTAASTRLFSAPHGAAAAAHGSSSIGKRRAVPLCLPASSSSRVTGSASGVSPPALLTCKDSSSEDEEEEEGEFWRDPKKKLRGRGRSGQLSSCRSSPACASQDFHYSCTAAAGGRPPRPVTPTGRPVSPAAVMSPFPVEVVQTARMPDPASAGLDTRKAAAGVAPVSGPRKRFLLGRSNRK